MTRLLLFVWALCGAGCSAHYVNATAHVRELADRGDERGALAALDETAAAKKLDELLVEADRGALLHREGDWAQSAKVLNGVARLADAREVVTLGDEFFGRAPWRMGTLERQGLHVLNTLNYLMLGDTESAAVEARLTDSLHLQARLEEELRQEVERSFSLVAFDDSVREYLERLVIGRYLAGLAHELDGNRDSAFIDYYDAWRLSRSSPPGAPTSVEHLGPWLLTQARALQRPELSTLEAAYPDLLPEEMGGTGEVVVVAEVGRIPERFIAGPPGQGFWTVRARAWPRSPTTVEVGEARVTAESVTSLENLLLRRGALGALTDTERVPSLWVNTALLGSYLLLPPVGAVLLTRRAVEVTLRMAQGWLTLPAEFRVTRVRLPVGTHELVVRSGESEQRRSVTVDARRPSVVVVQFNPDAR